MNHVLTPHERYMVLRAKDGWSLNLGADTLSVYTTRAGAREAAEKHVAAARQAGRNADWLDSTEDHHGDIA